MRRDDLAILAPRDDRDFYFKPFVAVHSVHPVIHGLDRTRCRDGELMEISRRIGVDLGMHVRCLTTTLEVEPQSSCRGRRVAPIV
jgi:hypothetical protein